MKKACLRIGLCALLAGLVAVEAAAQEGVQGGTYVQENEYMGGIAVGKGMGYMECPWVDWWTVLRCGEAAYMQEHEAKIRASRQDGNLVQRQVEDVPLAEVDGMIDFGEGDPGGIGVDERGRGNDWADEFGDSVGERARAQLRMGTLPTVRGQGSLQGR